MSKPHAQWVIERLARKVQRLKAENRALRADFDGCNAALSREVAYTRHLLDQLEQANEGYGPVHIPRR